MRKFFFLLLLLTVFLPSYSIDTHWDLEPQIIKNGVGNNTIYHVCYGSEGFMWFSTDKGISRYDGFRFRDYPLIMSIDSLSTPLHQAVKMLKEGSDGLFYALLYQGGITCFDKEIEQFLPVRFDRPLKLKEIQDFCWNDGNLYLATSQGVFESRPIRKKEGKDDFVYCILNPEPLIKGKITNLCTDGKTNLYFAVDREKVIHYDLVTKRSSVIREYDVVNRLFLRQGNLWICRLWNDIVCYDLKSHKERVVSLEGGDQSDFSNSYVTDMVMKDKQTFYLTTWDGLYKLRFENQNLCESPFTLTLLTQGERAFHSRIENKMTSLLWDDKQQILWVGTFGGGVVKFDISDSMYSRVRQNFKSRVDGMVEDAKGYIWLTVTDGGIMRSDTPSFSMDTHFEPWTKVSGLSGRYHIYKGKDGNIWLGNNLGEIIFVNPLTEDVESFQLKNNEGGRMQAVIHCFCLDSWNRLWVGTSNGLVQVDPKTHGCKSIQLPGEIKNVFAITEDKEGNVWVGTDKGLKRLETNGDQIRVEGNYEKENGLEEAGVRTLYVNNYNQIYAAYLNVVVRIDGREKDKIESVYTLQSGLTDGHVSCMVDDHIGNTWAGNNVGVMTIRNGQEAFYSYLSVGNCSAVCRLNDGRLLWANSWGLIFFDPSATKGDSSKKCLMLTDVEVGGETVLAGEKRNGQMILSVSPEKQEKLVFASDNNDFHLFFSDLRYGLAQRKIAYRLLPVDKEWKMIPLAEGLWFNGLAAGKYTLQAKLVFPDGKEGDVIEIPLVVKGKWYQTIWAYIMYVLLLGGLSYFFYSYFRKKDHRKQIHRDREMILKENLNLEKLKQEQKKEIEAMRNRLLMLFVQELRTPLSLIIAPLKELQKDDAQTSQLSLQVAYRNSLRMVDACDQLLAVYGQGNMESKLEVAPYSVDKMIDSSLFGVRDLLKVYTIDFHCEKRIKKEMEFYVDKKKIEFVIHNLLTNAFTHTHYAGTVSLSVCEVVNDNMHYVCLIVEDDGKERVRTVEQLMSENEGSERDMSAAQMGFTIMQQMIEAHYGTITLESTEGKGTKVTVNLPADRDVFENNPNIQFIDPEELTEVAELEPESAETQKQDLAVEDAVVQQDQQLPLFAEALPAEEVASPVAGGVKKTILIVEDHKDIRLYLKVLFGNEYNLLMATNGQEGVDTAMKEMPDLIICDVMMPVKDGFECCREVKENPETCSIPFIMLTAKVEDDDIIHGLQLGADDYVLKPFTPGILKAKVSSLINGRQTLKQMYTKLFKLPGTDTIVVSEPEQAGEEVKTEDPFITAVIKIVEENICEADFSVKKLAAEMNMSQPTLYRKVKQSTDYTIIELIRGVRMRRAGVLLKTKQYAVQEVAEMVGYNDIPTFRKHFVDAFGTTPSTYE
ncbi:hybrid sensor histidine kinase/response regulator transcription factor [Bacteroides thetaiotaomicron]|uniref:hybrid sensor histidine kinase/response regulator transcription factor n=1 Tax=Bacteroides thetaiotaomicron TaxID=818 RepID=UPI002165B323|nr:response regulator [Bacteroides thetaiotaomicron]MCS2599098.1 response regulator [Bacteroides thetaiotaomicron]